MTSDEVEKLIARDFTGELAACDQLTEIYLSSGTPSRPRC